MDAVRFFYAVPESVDLLLVLTYITNTARTASRTQLSEPC